jgi:DNA-binding NarL/FixJ family response regulator
VEAALRLRPDLTILDVTMPSLNGIDAARQIKKEWPQAKLLFLTMHASAVYLREAVEAGGMGYVLKSSATEELRTAIHKVLKGQAYLAPSFDREVLESVHASIRKPGKSSVQLTGRQREVLQLIAEGRVNKEIAATLKVSVKTVEFHRGRIMSRLGVHSMAELIRWAVQAGLVGE